MLRVLMTTKVALGRLRWSHGLRYDHSMLEYKVIKCPPWLLSMMLNFAIVRKTNVRYSHLWQPLPWFCFFRRLPWTIQATAGATVEWQQEWQWSNRSSISNCLYPFWDWHEVFTFVCFVEKGWFPIWILDKTDKTEYLADSEFGFWTTLDSVQIWTDQSKWLIQWDFWRL